MSMSVRVIQFRISTCSDFFFFNDTATTEIYTLSLHDALPILASRRPRSRSPPCPSCSCHSRTGAASPLCTWCTLHKPAAPRSEEHTSELQSRLHLVCRLLLEKKKHRIYITQMVETTIVLCTIL